MNIKQLVFLIKFCYKKIIDKLSFLFLVLDYCEFSPFKSFFFVLLYMIKTELNMEKLLVSFSRYYLSALQYMLCVYKN